jgi:hypothetical protein
MCDLYLLNSVTLYNGTALKISLIHFVLLPIPHPLGLTHTQNQNVQQFPVPW